MTDQSTLECPECDEVLSIADRDYENIGDPSTCPYCNAKLVLACIECYDYDIGETVEYWYLEEDDE